jgi:hypothetical protein
MGFLLILPILVSGFIYCHLHPFYYYKLNRYEGQYLYLQAARFGIYCLAIAWLIQSILLFITTIKLCIPIPFISSQPNYLVLVSDWLIDSKIVSDPIKANSYAWIITISILMITVVPALNASIFKLLYSHKHKIKSDTDLNLFIMQELFADSPLDSALFEAMLHEKPLMIDMEDRKVYVCNVVSMGEPNENEAADQEIAVLPILSGYREKETLKVHLNTGYQALNVSSALVLRQENIISIREFEWDIWDKFNHKGEGEASPEIANKND